MKKIGLFCLCLASLSLVGCFHVPDEDWLPSKNKVNTGDSQKNDEVENAINEFMDGVNMISSDWDKLKNEEIDDIDVENKANDDEEIIDNEIDNKEIENDVNSEE